MDSSKRVMKYLLFSVNFVIFIAGTIVIVTSVRSLYSKPSYIEETKYSLNDIFIILVLIGIIWIYVATYGIVIDSQKIKCMLLTYAIIIFLLLVKEIIVVVQLDNFQKEMIKLLEKDMEKSLQLYNDNTFVRNFWDITQSTLQCCGVNSWEDWKIHGLEVPNSCCKSNQFFGIIFSCTLYTKVKYQQSTLYETDPNNQDPENMGLRNI